MTNIKTVFSDAKRNKVVIENHDGDWWVMQPNGQVEAWETPGHALDSVKKYQKRNNQTVTITVIEWRNVPDGWKPPTA